MCKFLSCAPRRAGIAATTGHFRSLVIVPVLAMLLASPASAQTISDSGTQSTGTAVVINIDKARQKMTVFLDGVEKYDWPVSTGRAGYSTPSGTYTATSMNEVWYSKEWDNSPMPHSIFFIKDGHAIHGSYEVKTLGKPVSHGCVRISPANAATLYALVKKYGLKNTKVVLAGVTPGGEYKVASPASPRFGQAIPDRYDSDNDNAQPQWAGGFFGRVFGGPYYSGSQGYYGRPPRGY
ncbi:MAG TPA: L,D-transpeptidase [Candidatus Acidoferrales bacterium]